MEPEAQPSQSCKFRAEGGAGPSPSTSKFTDEDTDGRGLRTASGLPRGCSEPVATKDKGAWSHPPPLSLYEPFVHQRPFGQVETIHF